MHNCQLHCSLCHTLGFPPNRSPKTPHKIFWCLVFVEICNIKLSNYIFISFSMIDNTQKVSKGINYDEIWYYSVLPSVLLLHIIFSGMVKNWLFGLSFVLMIEWVCYCKTICFCHALNLTTCSLVLKLITIRKVEI